MCRLASPDLRLLRRPYSFPRPSPLHHLGHLQLPQQATRMQPLTHPAKHRAPVAIRPPRRGDLLRMRRMGHRARQHIHRPPFAACGNPLSPNYDDRRPLPMPVALYFYRHTSWRRPRHPVQRQPSAATRMTMRFPPRLSGIPATVAAITTASSWVAAEGGKPRSGSMN